MNPLATSLATLLVAALSARAEVTASFSAQAPAHLEAGGDMTLTESDVQFLFHRRPWPEWKGALSAGFGAGLTTLTFSRHPPRDQDLYHLRVPIQLAFQPGPHTRFLFRLTPGLRSDLKAVDHHDVRLNGLFLALYPWRPRVQLAGGLLLSDSTGSYGLLPAVGLRWQPTDAFTLELFMPRPRLLWKAGERHTFFLSAGPSGGEWNIGRGTDDDPERDLHYKAISTSVGLEWRLTSGPVLTASVGALFGRTLETDGAPDPVLGRKRDLHDTAFASLSIAWGAPRRPGGF